MTRPMRVSRFVGGGAAAVLRAAGRSGAAPAAAASRRAARRATAAKSPAITLITGDRVRLVTQPDGKLAVGIEPAPGREHVGFARESSAGHVTVVPADAEPLLAAGRLDPRLFDVTELARQGLTDAASSALPLIVTGTAAAAPAAPAAAARTVGALPSIRGSVVREDRRQGSAYWSWLKAAGGAGKVWLDGVAHPLDDSSAAQIGAPTA